MKSFHFVDTVLCVKVLIHYVADLFQIFTIDYVSHADNHKEKHTSACNLLYRLYPFVILNLYLTSWFLFFVVIFKCLNHYNTEWFQTVTDDQISHKRCLVKKEFSTFCFMPVIALYYC